MVIPSLSDDESSEWYCTIGRITTFKFENLRFSKALQFYPCPPLSISDDRVVMLGFELESYEHLEQAAGGREGQPDHRPLLWQSNITN